MTHLPLPMERWRAVDAPATLFRYDTSEAWFYAPGYLAVVQAARADAFEAELKRPAPPASPIVQALQAHARAAQQAWEEIYTRPFDPVCLTLYLHSACNLQCVYCYASADSTVHEKLEAATVRRAAEIVAAACERRGLPLVAVFHGGGEPSLYLPQVEDFLRLTHEAAEQHGARVFRYIATNGVMSTTRAGWLAEKFDEVGLSCDGPEYIQAAQRPLDSGASSTPYIERTARVVREAGKPLRVRVTVTPATLHQQALIAEYLCRVLQPQAIHVEPMYGVGRAQTLQPFAPEQADDFVREFLRAREVAASYGVAWHTSGSRVGEVHGPYCQVEREVLHVVPGGVATACFKTSDAVEARTRGVAIRFAEPWAVDELRHALRAEPSRCAACFNRFHCTRECPDACALSGWSDTPGFRCRAQQALTHARLQALVPADVSTPAWGVEVPE